MDQKLNNTSLNWFILHDKCTTIVLYVAGIDITEFISCFFQTFVGGDLNKEVSVRKW